MPEVESNLAALRHKHGLSAIQLAAMADVSRQTIYAIEGGSFIPNTAVALKLARALNATVEDIFALPDAALPELRSELAEVLAGSETPRGGQPVQLCRIDKRLVASAPSEVQWHFPAADAVVLDKPPRGGRTRVQVFESGGNLANRLLVAGCDPGISVLARHLSPAGVELVLAHRNSSQALALLQAGSVHIAGTHLRDQSSGESNLPEIHRMFTKNSVAVISFAVWEEGIVTAAGNPKRIRGIEDFGRKKILMVNREKGAGSRNLLDSRLIQLGIPPACVRGYKTFAPGHLAAARQVHSGAVDCCIATRAAARTLGLGFVPLVSERYDLAISKRHLELPAIQHLLDTLNRSTFRRELEALGGYDARSAGQRSL